MLKLFDMTSDKKYRDVGLELLGAVAGTQDLASPSEPHYGGIKGSLPIYGRYAPLQYPNWATKFFIDALLTKSAVMNEKSDQSVNLLIPG